MLWFFLGCTNQEPHHQINRPSPPIDSIRAQLSEGDILLKCGYGQISRLMTIYLAEEIKISHAAIVAKVEKDRTTLVHSVSLDYGDQDGVQYIDLHKFLLDTREGSFFIVRPKIGEDSLNNVLVGVQEKLTNQVPFDHDFDLNDTTALFCSEFVQLVFESRAGVKCFEVKQLRDRKSYVFNGILNHPDFETVFEW